MGGNNIEVGREAGNCIAQLLHRRGNVLELWGRRGSTPAIQRHQGLQEVIRSFPDIRQVAELNGEWKQHLIIERLPAVLKAHPDVNLIFAHNDAMGAGAYQVCRQLGLDHTIQIVGVDGLPGPNAGMQYVEDGILKATMVYPTGGKEVIQLALRILNKEPYQKENLLGTMVIDSSNVMMLKRQTEKIASQDLEIQRQTGRIQEQIKIYQNQQTVVYILVALLLATCILGAFLFLSLLENRKVNRQLKQQNAEILAQRNKITEMAEQARENTEAKFRFFTNFSHELRTPLTLIMGPVDDILTQKAPLLDSQRKDLELVQKNTRQLLHLVNLLMDFRKIEVGKMPMRLAEHDLVGFVRDVMSVFDKVAHKRKITYRLLAAESAIPVWFDASLLDKVFYNLFANAFKFTSDQGIITVSLHRDIGDKTVRVQVADNGVGIGADEQRHIFDWFYQGQSASTATGSGIGLALSKELAQLHQGSLSVSSEPGHGSTFELCLPLTQSPLTTTSPAPPNTWNPSAFSTSIDDTTFLADADLSVLPTGQLAETTLLLIENNADIRAFLREKLHPHFQLIEADDGATGLRQAFDTLPDLIICDVMMVGKSGLEIVTSLKNDWRTSHIPVVMLTARNAPEHQLEGVKAGADLYLTKPFSPTYLIESLKMLLRSRERLRDHFRRELSLETTTLSPQRTDRAFIDSLSETIEQQLANSELTVDDLARLIGLSRMQLYRKTKALLGCGVTDYIQTVRLNKARQLLLKPATTIADVAYSVGFSSPTYFATAFKNKFNLSPSEFKNLHVSSSV